jgi:hypothetical protein
VIFWPDNLVSKGSQPFIDDVVLPLKVHICTISGSFCRNLSFSGFVILEKIFKLHVHKKFTKFRECKLRSIRGVEYTTEVGAVYSKHAGKIYM